ncbi:MAG: glycine oxidase ThiO [Gammaproteobacteria bacterium]|nr:MAG: glycine oxidase ThiO [Gammaproteobacteria bacterium]
MPDCIIVGGGIIGLLTARQLFLEGVDVLLLEKGPLGGESSWAGGGIISPLYPWYYDDAVNVLAQRSKILYPSLTKELFEENGNDSELINSGLFTVIDDDPTQRQVIFDWIDRWSIDARYVDEKAAIRQIESTVGDAVDKGIWMPDILQIRNPKFVVALKASFEHLSIPYQEHCTVEEIITDGSKVTGVKTGQENYPTDKVVIASGAWSAQFSVTQASVKVNPVKGQMIMYNGEPDLVKRIVLAEGHYIIPRKDGRILAGSTLEKIGFDKSTSSSALDELHQAAVQLIPLLADLKIERQWAGLRPGTEKGIPYICQHDDVEGLYVHAGHFRNGIVLGAASAQLMVDVILNREPWCDAIPYTMQAAH